MILPEQVPSDIDSIGRLPFNNVSKQIHPLCYVRGNTAISRFVDHFTLICKQTIDNKF